MPRPLAPIVSFLLVAGLTACESQSEPQEATSLDVAFEEAAQEFDVPRDLLVSIAYSLTRLQDGDEGAHEHGGVRGHGVMDLGAGSPWDGPSIRRAARRLDVKPGLVMHDSETNIRAAASELRWKADQLEEETGIIVFDIGDWAEVVGWYSGSEDGGAQQGFTRQVYTHIEGGLQIQTSDGTWLDIPSQEVDIPILDPMSGGTYGDSPLSANFVGAASCNYSNDTRSSSEIDTIVVHTAQGSYSGTYNWFQNCSASASAHYVIRSSDGEITQMVMEEDRAWHAGHSSTNSRSIGIELEGFIAQPETWYTDDLYESLAALIADISLRHGMTLDDAHIIGHNEVPGCSVPGGGGASCHTDPGDGFDWGKLMALVGVSTPGGGTGGGGTGGGTGGGGGTSIGTGELVGFVRAGSIYNSSSGIQGAVVALTTGESVTTDSTGWYAFESVGEGTVEITVEAGGYDTGAKSTEVTEGITNWSSIALNEESGGGTGGGGTGGGGTGGSTTGSVPTPLSPVDWANSSGESVTMTWSDVSASSYEIKIYWHDGEDWNYYYGYTTTSPLKTFWPVVTDVYYGWTVRAFDGSTPTEWTDTSHFYYEG